MTAKRQTLEMPDKEQLKSIIQPLMGRKGAVKWQNGRHGQICGMSDLWRGLDGRVRTNIKVEYNEGLFKKCFCSTLLLVLYFSISS